MVYQIIALHLSASLFRLDTVVTSINTEVNTADHFAVASLLYRVEKKMSIICLSQDAAAACSSSSKLVSSSLSLLTKDTKVLLLLSPFTNVSFWKMYESLSCLSLVAESNFFCRLRKIPLLNLKLEKKVFLSPLRYNLFQSKCRFSIKLKFEVQILLVDTSDVLIFEHCE